MEVGATGFAFSRLTEIIENKKERSPSDRFSLENNMDVLEILDVAICSAKSGQTVGLGVRR